MKWYGFVLLTVPIALCVMSATSLREIFFSGVLIGIILAGVAFEMIFTYALKNPLTIASTMIKLRQ